MSSFGTFLPKFKTGPGVLPASCKISTRLFAVVKLLVYGVKHPPTCRAGVKRRVEVYLYCPSGHSWPLLGWTLPHYKQM